MSETPAPAVPHHRQEGSARGVLPPSGVDGLFDGVLRLAVDQPLLERRVRELRSAVAAELRRVAAAGGVAARR